MRRKNREPAQLISRWNLTVNAQRHLSPVGLVLLFLFPLMLTTVDEASIMKQRQFVDSELVVYRAFGASMPAGLELGFDRTSTANRFPW